jgi:AraC-like DNA-binding protein
LGRTINYLCGPSLYFYARSITDSGFHFKRRHWVHLLPMMLYFLYMSCRFHFHRMIQSRALTPLESGVLILLFYAILVAYIVSALRVLRIYNSEIKKHGSAIEKINLSWLRFILIGVGSVVIIEVLFFSTSLMGFHLRLMLSLVYAIIFILVTVGIYRILSQPVLFVQPERYKHSNLSEADKKIILNQILGFIQKEKSYLNPALTLKDLAETIHLPQRAVSQVINEFLGKNFYDFINAYRIEEAKRLLTDPAFGAKTVLEILYQVGYNSKSSFNHAFKDNTGMTPLEFKEKHQKTI